ncbi:MAG: hypothetical protein ABI969_14190 [bacterium]
MDRQGRLGSAIYGVGMLGFGLVSLIRFDAVPDLEPLPAWLPLRPLVAMLAALILLVAGTALLTRWHTDRAAGTVGALLSVWLVTLFVPQLVAQPRNGGTWVVVAEIVAMGAAAWMFSSATSASADSVLMRRVAQGARIMFGLAFLEFGASHFEYHGYVESVIPGWIPFHTFFAYAVGVAHLAAGVSLLTRVREQLATALLAVMFGSWVVFLHAPRVMAAPRTGNEWTSLFVAISMCGASLIVRSSLSAAYTARAYATPRPMVKQSATLAES